MTESLSSSWVDLSRNWGDLFLLWSWQALLLLGLAWILVRMDRSRIPASRHRIWLAGMLIVAVLPIGAGFTALLPVEQTAMESLAYVAKLPSAISLVPEDLVVVASTDDMPSKMVVSYKSIAWRVLFIAWLGGFLGNIAALCYSWWNTHLLRKGAWNISTLPFSTVPIGFSSGITSPIIAGVFRPLILLPGTIEEWTTQKERQAIILHEIAHLQRRDHHLIIFQKVLGALFFFHPMVRYASRQLSLERELACDHYVLGAGADHTSYAEAILKVAERGIKGRQGLEPAFSSSKKFLERRMDMILNPQFVSSHRPRRFAGIAKAFLLVVAMVGVLIPRIGVEARVLPEPAPIVETPAPQAAPVITPRVVETVVRPAVAPTVPVVVAQNPVALGSIAGKIIDATGALIPGVAVKIKSAQIERTVMTSDQGAYEFAGLPTDSYRLEASTPGFQPQVLQLDLSGGTAQRYNLTLNLGAMATSVEVSARRIPAVTIPAAPRVPPGPPGPPPRIGGDVAMAQLIAAPKPVYPESLRAAGVQDYVMIQAVIGGDGTVQSPRVIRNAVHPDLTNAALEAVKLWRYRPATLNGVPAEVLTTITVNFSLVD